SILLLIPTSIYFLYQFLFTITTTSCTFTHLDCPPEVFVELEKLKTKNLLQLNHSQLTTKITTSNPLIEQANLKLTLPGQVKLDLTPVELLAQISIASNSSTLLIATNHTVVGFSQSPQPDLNVIIAPEAKNIRIGDTLTDSTFIQAFKLSYTLTDYSIPFDSVHLIDATSARIFSSHAIQIIFDLNKSHKQQVITLNLILDQDLPPIKSIDLRYQKPTITFLP
ncbi:hypothetical protein ACFL2V_21130, partial [Pseudomonadota bacterium]